MYQTEQNFFNYKNKIDEITSVKKQNYIDKIPNKTISNSFKKNIENDSENKFIQTVKLFKQKEHEIQQQNHQENQIRSTRKIFDPKKALNEKQEMAELFQLKMEEERLKRMNFQQNKRTILENLQLENEFKKEQLKLEKEKTQQAKMELHEAVRNRLEIEKKLQTEQKKIEFQNRSISRQLMSENLALKQQQKSLQKEAVKIQHQMLLYSCQGENTFENENTDGGVHEKLEKIKLERIKWEEEKKRT